VQVLRFAVQAQGRAPRTLKEKYLDVCVEVEVESVSERRGGDMRLSVFSIIVAKIDFAKITIKHLN
jgi:hypothetical protein